MQAAMILPADPQELPLDPEDSVEDSVEDSSDDRLEDAALKQLPLEPLSESDFNL